MAKSPAEEIAVDGLAVRISNPDKVYCPDRGITKRQVVEHYVAVREPLLAVLYEHGGAIGPTHVQARVRTLREAAPALKDVVDLARLLGHR